MFGSIARRYDLMNNLMTAGMHHRWRRQGVDMTGLRPGDEALDVCCGTGDFAFALKDRVGPMGNVTAVDFSRRMLDVARDKERRLGKPVEFRWGDATDLEFADDSFNAVTVGFGVRNIPELDRVFSEMARVTRPGGKVVCLEITQPTRQPFRGFYNVWFDRLVPGVGRLISRDSTAYSYLPASVRRFPTADKLEVIMREAGLSDVSHILLAGSIIALHRGTA